MSIEQMRQALTTKSPYQSKSWSKKVKSMSPVQVIAVYTSMLQRHLITK